MAAPARPLLILGTRLFALEVSDLVSEIPGFELAGFVENLDRVRCREKIEGLPVYWVDELERFAESHWAVCSLGTTERSAFTESRTGGRRSRQDRAGEHQGEVIPTAP